MGDGKIAMIIDPEGIIDKSNIRLPENIDEYNKKVLKEQSSTNEKQSLLLFRCSGTERLGVSLSMVSRIEEIETDQVENIGNLEFIKHRGSSLRIIRPEDYLPISKNKLNQEKCYIIIPKYVKNPMGLLIEKIDDTILVDVVLEVEGLEGRGILGTTVINDNIVNIINMHELFEMIDAQKNKKEETLANNDKKKRQGKVVLLAEDTPFYQKLARDYIKSEGYTVIVCTNGVEALEILEKNKIDAIVSDIQMPLMDGLELVKTIRNNSKYKHLPMIALTSLMSEEQKNIGIDAGFDMYLSKIDKKDLLENLELIINKKKEIK
jgi:two-component system chemotaxis sensor kinase CheA